MRNLLVSLLLMLGWLAPPVFAGDYYAGEELGRLRWEAEERARHEQAAADREAVQQQRQMELDALRQRNDDLWEHYRRRR